MDSHTKVKIENIFGVPFQNQGFVSEALTDKVTNKRTNCERFEILGDSVLKTANLDNERLTYVCVKNGLHNFIQHSDPELSQKIRKYEDEAFDQPPEYKAVNIPPKILADVLEALIGVVYYGNDSLDTAWQVFKKLAYPLMTPESFEKNPTSEVNDLCVSSNRNMQFQRYRNTSLLFIDGVCFRAASHRNIKIVDNRACRMYLDELSKEQHVDGNGKKRKIGVAHEAGGSSNGEDVISKKGKGVERE